MFFSFSTGSGTLQQFKNSEHLRGNKLKEISKTFHYSVPEDLIVLEFELRVEKKGSTNQSILVPTNFKKSNEELTNLSFRVAKELVDKTKFSFLSIKQEDYTVYHAPLIPYTQQGVLTFMPTFMDVYILQSSVGTSYHISNLGELCEKDFFEVLRNTPSLDSLYPKFLAFAQNRQLLSAISPKEEPPLASKKTKSAHKI